MIEANEAQMSLVPTIIPSPSYEAVESAFKAGGPILWKPSR